MTAGREAGASWSDPLRADAGPGRPGSIACAICGAAIGEVCGWFSPDPPSTFHPQRASDAVSAVVRECDDARAEVERLRAALDSLARAEEYGPAVDAAIAALDPRLRVTWHRADSDPVEMDMRRVVAVAIRAAAGSRAKDGDDV